MCSFKVTDDRIVNSRNTISRRTQNLTEFFHSVCMSFPVQSTRIKICALQQLNTLLIHSSSSKQTTTHFDIMATETLPVPNQLKAQLDKCKSVRSADTYCKDRTKTAEVSMIIVFICFLFFITGSAKEGDSLIHSLIHSINECTGF